MTDLKSNYAELQQYVNQLFSETPNRCQLCESLESSVYERLDHHGINLTYRICNSCGLVYQAPRIPESNLSAFYESQYRMLYLGQATPRDQELEIQRKRAIHLVNFLVAEHGFIPDHHLDIGSGSGALLHETHSRFKCRVTGIELDEAHRIFAVNNGLTVYESLEKWREHESTPASLVSMSHVLEHLTDPIAYLIRVRETVMSPNSRLLIEVPNLYFHPSFEIAHPFAFSLTTLSNVLSKAGYRVIRHKFHSFPGHRFCPWYITVSAFPSTDVIQTTIHPDVYSRQRRNWGQVISESERLTRRALRHIRARFQFVIKGQTDR